MCGIAGAVNWGDRSAVGRMLSAMRHRGPDDSGSVERHDRSGAPVWLANVRLSILDLSRAGHMPMANEQGTIWITYNGEVYNFQTLRNQLESQGHTFRSHSDTEVVLKLYEQLGPAFVEKLNGMFAIAIWDGTRNELLLVRDRLGIKPLYYAIDQGRLVFASEVRALLQSGFVRRRVNPTALGQYLGMGSVYDPETFVYGVCSLPPACRLIFSDCRADVERYWRIPERPAGQNRSAPDLDAELKEVLRGAFVQQLVSDVPIGVFLSGGTDSSALVAHLTAAGRGNVSTFSIAFKESDYSEARFARLVAQRCGTDHHELCLSQTEVLQSLPEVIAGMDQPTIDGVNTYFISRHVHALGLKVALTGLGGDELFAGYSTFRTVPRMERLARMLLMTPAVTRRAAASVMRKICRGSAKSTALIGHPASLLHPYFLARMLFVPAQQQELLRREAGFVPEPNRAFLESLWDSHAHDAVNRVSYLELRNYMANTLLRDSDAMSMAHSLELRVPFLDHRLVEFMFSIPGSSKVDGSTNKPLLVRSAKGLVPDEVFQRPKRGFTLPFEHWLKQELRKEMETELLNGNDNPIGEWLSSTGVRSVWADFLAGRTSWSRPWAIYVMKKWAAQHLA